MIGPLVVAVLAIVAVGAVFEGLLIVSILLGKWIESR